VSASAPPSVASPRLRGAAAVVAAASLAIGCFASLGRADATDGAGEASATISGEGAGSGDTSRVEGLPIKAIVLEPRNIFEPVPDGAFSGLYRVANRLHVRTREGTLRQQLLFEPGDRWRAGIGRELARNLRALDFLNPIAITARRDDDSVVVHVVTQDLWTTTPEFNFESSGGRRYGAISFTERNLAGFGKYLSYTWKHDPVGISQGVSYRDPNLFGTHGRLQVDAGSGSEGASSKVWVGMPFYSLATRRSYGVAWERVTSNPVFYERGAEIASFNRRFESTEAWWAFGGMQDSIVRRLKFGVHLEHIRLGPTVAKAPRIPIEFEGDEESRRVRRGSLTFRHWRPNYLEVREVEQMGFVEDVDVGGSIEAEGGYAPPGFEGVEEGYVRVRADHGLETRAGFGTVAAQVTSRFRGRPLEIVQEVRGRWVNQTVPRHTFVLAAWGVSGIDAGREFQAVVGGLNGLRAYEVQALAGTRLWRLNVEDRMMLARDFAGLFSIGTVGFVDAARAWGPGAAGSGWFYDAGIGLRVAMPQWTLNQVLRIDLAWPIEPTRDGSRAPVLSVGSSQAF
jgi:hypothetical protein